MSITNPNLEKKIFGQKNRKLAKNRKIFSKILNHFLGSINEKI